MRRAPSWASRIRLVAACFGLALAGIVTGVLILFVFGFVLVALLDVTITPLGRLALSLVAIQGLGFPLVAVLYFSYRGRSLRSFVPVSVPSLRELGISLGAWIAAIVVTPAVATVVVGIANEQPASNAAGETAQQNPEIIPLLIPLVFLLNAPGEELLFRGVIQGLLAERFSAWAAVVLATVAFAPVHIVALIGSPTAALLTIVIISVPSLVFGSVYELTDNLVVPSLVHALFNSTLFVGVYVSALG
ncbi:MAG: lysostaphin resistance A-like protein [Salinirussus sp.]